MRTDTPFPLRYTEWVRRRVTSTSVYTPACLLFAPFCFTRDIVFRWQVRWNVTAPLWDEIFARELYNHTGDSGDAFTTDAFENTNQADDPALGSLVGKLSEQLRQEFKPFILAYTK